MTSCILVFEIEAKQYITHLNATLVWNQMKLVLGSIVAVFNFQAFDCVHLCWTGKIFGRVWLSLILEPNQSQSKNCSLIGFDYWTFNWLGRIDGSSKCRTAEHYDMDGHFFLLPLSKSQYMYAPRYHHVQAVRPLQYLFPQFHQKKSSYPWWGEKKNQYFNSYKTLPIGQLIKSYMIDVSSFQTKIQNKPLSLRSANWKAFSSNNKMFDLVRVVTPGITKRNKNWTFWGSPFSITIWLVYVIVRWREQGPSTRKIYFENIILSTRGGYCRPNFFFGKSKEHFLYAVYTKH